MGEGKKSCHKNRVVVYVVKYFFVLISSCYSRVVRSASRLFTSMPRHTSTLLQVAGGRPAFFFLRRHITDAPCTVPHVFLSRQTPVPRPNGNRIQGIRYKEAREQEINIHRHPQKRRP